MLENQNIPIYEENQMFWIDLYIFSRQQGNKSVLISKYKYQ